MATLSATAAPEGRPDLDQGLGKAGRLGFGAAIWATSPGRSAFPDGHPPPTSRMPMQLRGRLAQLHRLLEGLRSVSRRFEEDENLPEPLLLPATLVTGIFGMNTGGMPFAGHHGTILATLLAAAAAWAAYALLRWLGFMQM